MWKVGGYYKLFMFEVMRVRIKEVVVGMKRYGRGKRLRFGIRLDKV